MGYLTQDLQGSLLLRKIEEGKDSEDKVDKEPLDNSGYLTRPYLEPLAKMKFRYNCERVVDLDKHEGMRR